MVDLYEEFEVENIIATNDVRCFYNVREDEVMSLLELLEENKHRLKIFWSANTGVPGGMMIVSSLSPEHERGHGVLNVFISQFNTACSGRITRPMQFTGGAQVYYRNRIIGNPDTSYTVDHRVEHSPNFVSEVHYHNTLMSYAAVRRRSIEWITHTADVMVVLTTLILGGGARFAYLVIRQTPAPGYNESDFRSFGTANLHHTTVTALRRVLPPLAQFRGVGFVDPATGAADPPCDDNNLPLYTYHIPGTWLLRQDNAGLRIHPHNAAAGGGIPTLDIDLYDLQDATRE